MGKNSRHPSPGGVKNSESRNRLQEHLDNRMSEQLLNGPLSPGQQSEI
jgi:hypothetical protein